MKRFSALFKHLSVEAISGDETDHRNGQPRYAITTLPWRSPDIRQWMQTLDDIRFSARINGGNRIRGGNFPRPRVFLSNRKERHLDSPAKGLPRNFYNNDWFASLDKYDQEALHCKPAEDLTFTPEVLK
jgi:hypothetical protein